VIRLALKLFPFRFKGIRVYLRPAPSLTRMDKEPRLPARSKVFCPLSLTATFRTSLIRSAVGSRSTLPVVFFGRRCEPLIRVSSSTLSRSICLKLRVSLSRRLSQALAIVGSASLKAPVPLVGEGVALGRGGVEPAYVYGWLYPENTCTETCDSRNYGKGGCGLMERSMLAVLSVPPITLARAPLAVLPSPPLTLA
jgi:hypothetical protein